MSRTIYEMTHAPHVAERKRVYQQGPVKAQRSSATSKKKAKHCATERERTKKMRVLINRRTFSRQRDNTLYRVQSHLSLPAFLSSPLPAHVSFAAFSSSAAISW